MIMMIYEGIHTSVTLKGPELLLSLFSMNNKVVTLDGYERSSRQGKAMI